MKSRIQIFYHAYQHQQATVSLHRYFYTDLVIKARPYPSSKTPFCWIVWTFFSEAFLISSHHYKAMSVNLFTHQSIPSKEFKIWWPPISKMLFTHFNPSNAADLHQQMHKINGKCIYNSAGFFEMMNPRTTTIQKAFCQANPQKSRHCLPFST